MLDTKQSQKQFLTDLRWSAPNSNITVRDKEGRLLRTETPTGQILTIFRRRNYVKANTN